MNVILLKEDYNGEIFVVHQALKNIIAKSSTLYERMNSADYIFAPPSNDQIVKERLSRWENLLGSAEKLQSRLRWEGWDIGKVYATLSDNISLNATAKLPSWATILDSIIQKNTRIYLSQERDALPFEEILFAMVQVARAELFSRLKITSLDSAPLNYCSPSAYQDLEYSLLQRLSKVCTETLTDEFNKIRPAGYQYLATFLTDTDVTTKKYYNQFVEQLSQPEHKLKFFQNYPVLGRLIATIIEFWVTFVIEFFTRLDQDLSDIHRVFPAVSQSKKIIALQADLSDPHQQGRVVIVVQFENNSKLVYKPKNLSLTIIYHELLQWCNQQEDGDLPFKTTTVLTRKNYGWEEFIEHQSCENAAAAKRFYERAGRLLCLLHVLGASDCHSENLIAQGEHLFLIDTETLLYPITVLQEDSFLENSLLRVGMLPRWQAHEIGGIVYDICGLGCPEAIQGKLKIPTWRYLNTDQMYLCREIKADTLFEKNIPTLNNKLLAAVDYLPELTLGFQKAYLFFMRHRQDVSLLNIIEKFSQCTIRLVCRATQVYYEILQNSCSPDCLKDGIDRSISLDISSRAFLLEPVKPNYWSILVTELIALQQMDIPYFLAPSVGCTLNTDSDPINNFFETSSYDLLLMQLSALSETDLAQQLLLIKGSFSTQTKSFRPNETSFTHQKPQNNDVVADFSKTRLLSLASEIARVIERHVIKDHEGNSRWVAPMFDRNVNRYQFQPIGDNLYDGNIGIVLFLSALDFATEQNCFRDLALSALQQLRTRLKKNTATIRTRLGYLGIGGVLGLGSLIYGLTHISHFFQLPDLLEDATQIANLITPEAIKSDKNLDILGGSAGLLLGLLALYSKTNDTTLLAKAILCGQHLLKQQNNAILGAWLTIGEVPLTGFSHGAAGITYALLRLYAVTQDIAYLKAAIAGIEFERSVFSKEQANWPDFRAHRLNDGECKEFLHAWCHGAPGIGLARLGGLSVLNTPQIQDEIAIALQTTKKYFGTSANHLCCGNFGKIEPIWIAGHRQKNDELKKLSFDMLLEIITQEEKFYLPGYQLHSAFSPGLFRGAAGMGYQLLRLAEPEKFPSILLLEATAHK